MKTSVVFALLSSVGCVLSTPVAEAKPQPGLHIGAPIDFSDAVEARLVARDNVDHQHVNRQVRTTNMPANPTIPPKTSSTATTAAPGTTQTIDVTGMTYINAMLMSHNVHRANHSEANLVWSTNLANIAAQTAASCVYQHDTATGGGGYGQNIGAGAAGNSAAGLITNLMYNGEIKNYPLPYGNNNPDMTNFGSWGHYSQLVWSDTTSVGCATQYCPNGLKNANGIPPYFTVCNYSPPGNYGGQYAKVKAPNGGGTVVIVGS